jgi:hypothetical protein
MDGYIDGQSRLAWQFRFNEEKPLAPELGRYAAYSNVYRYLAPLLLPLRHHKYLASFFLQGKNRIMEVGSEDSPVVNDLITTLQTIEWMVAGFGVLCAAASVVFVLLGSVSGLSFLLFAGSCVFITLCINKVRDLAQVVERLDEKVEDKTD